MSAYMFALGYHGCDATVADDLIEGKEMRRSENKYDWLGHGYYFWEDDPVHARLWAVDLAKRPNSTIKKPSVVGAVIRLGNCLNLAESKALSEVKITYEAMNAAEKEMGLSLLPENKGKDLKKRFLDCFIFEWLHQFREEKNLAPYDTVRGYFSEGEKLYPGSGIHQQDHVQICVRNLGCIMGFFRPRFEF